MDLDALFPGRERRSHGATRDDLPLERFEVVHVAPGAPGEAHVYLTQGAGETGSELVILSPREDAWLVDVLTSVAYFQCFYGFERGDAYKYARGWLPNSMLNRLLAASTSPVEGFLRLVPITEDEEKLAKKQGAAALEALLASVDPLAVDRASLA
jgi:hypothetical protein